LAGTKESTKAHLLLQAVDFFYFSPSALNPLKKLMRSMNHSKASQTNKIGYLYVSLAAMLCATAGTAAKFLFNRGMTPYQLIQLRVTLAWNVLHSPLEAVMQYDAPAGWIWIVFIAVCGTILPFGLYFEGIKRIRSTHASITATLEPITAGVISALFLGEFLSPLQILGGLLVIASI
jgi:drug/metabolite transporter (DMT)-like permease